MRTKASREPVSHPPSPTAAPIPGERRWSDLRHGIALDFAAVSRLGVLPARLCMCCGNATLTAEHPDCALCAEDVEPIRRAGNRRRRSQ